MAERKSFLLRLPPELMDDLNRWAADELRSLNGQIEYVLREAVRRRKGDTANREENGRESTQLSE